LGTWARASFLGKVNPATHTATNLAAVCNNDPRHIPLRIGDVTSLSSLISSPLELAPLLPIRLTPSLGRAIEPIVPLCDDTFQSHLFDRRQEHQKSALPC